MNNMFGISSDTTNFTYDGTNFQLTINTTGLYKIYLGYSSAPPSSYRTDRLNLG